MSDSSLVLALKRQQRELWQAGQRRLVEDLLRDHPQLSTSPEVFSLVYDEFLLREEVGHPALLIEFQQRFPHFAEKLAAQVQLHHVFGSSRHQDSSNNTDLLLQGDVLPTPDIPGFEDFKPLGRGGMGIVYRARQNKLGRLVAIKMMIGGVYAGANNLQRFKAETEAVAYLDHPHIVPIYEVGEWRGMLYFTMKYVEGGTLTEKLLRYLEDRPKAASLVATIARALHYAHQRGILHRDLKPSNILIDNEGKPYVTDFGLAKRVDDTQGLTGSQGFVGTPGYLAPEQVSGEHAATVAVDVWGLGTILYELLTQKAPYPSDTPMKAVQALLDHDPQRPRSVDGTIDPDLETICLKCLTREPERRYPSALALAEDLERWVKGESIHARASRPMEKLYRWVKRRPAMAALAGAALFSTLLGIAGITLALLYALAGWNRAAEETARATTESGRTERRRNEAENNLYFSRIAQASFEEKSNNPASAQRLLQLNVSGNGDPLDRRNWEWHYLQGLLHADLLSLSDVHEEITFDLALSPDGTQLATAGGSPYRPQPPDRVRLWNLWGEQAGKSIAEFPHPKFITQVRYLDQGKRLAWIGDDREQIVIADVATKAVQHVIPLPVDSHAVSFSPDGTHYVVVDTKGLCHLYDLLSMQTLATVDVKPQGMHFSLSPDHSMVAVVRAGAVHLHRFGSDTPMELPTPSISRGKPAFSSDGQYLAVGLAGGVVRLWNTHDGQLVQSFSGHTGDVRAVAFSPNEQYLATTGADHTIRLWSIRQGDEVLRLRGHQGRGMCLAFHPSGKFLISGAGQPSEVKVWDISRQQEYLNVHARNSRRVEALTFSPESSTLQVTRSQGGVQFVDAGSGSELKKTKIDLTEKPIRPAVISCFSSDGKLTASVSTNMNHVVITELANGTVVQQLAHTQNVTHLAFSADSKRLATSAPASKPGKQRVIHVWDVANGSKLSTVRCDAYLDDRPVYGPVALSPDGQLLVHEEYTLPTGGSRFCEVVLREAATGKEIRRLPNKFKRVEKMAFHPQSKLLALSCEKLGVVVFDLEKYRWLHEEALQGSSNHNSLETFWDMAFSPDGKRLAAVNRMQVLLWDTTTGQMVLTLRGAAPPAGDNGFNPRLAWSPNGKRLAASNSDTSFSIWDAGERQSPKAKQQTHAAALKREIGY